MPLHIFTTWINPPGLTFQARELIQDHIDFFKQILPNNDTTEVGPDQVIVVEDEEFL
jgi:hypothetical protein